MCIRDRSISTKPTCWSRSLRATSPRGDRACSCDPIQKRTTRQKWIPEKTPLILRSPTARQKVIGPVGAKLKFHGDAGRHPHGEVDAEQLAPEPRHVAPDLAARHHESALHDSEQKRQPERQRHEQKVIESRHRELKARQAYRIDMVHGDLFLSFTAATTGRARG